MKKYKNEPIRDISRDEHASNLKKLRSMGYKISKDKYACPNEKVGKNNE